MKNETNIAKAFTESQIKNSELLKENHDYANEIGKLRVQNESLQALNAELLEALKSTRKLNLHLYEGNTMGNLVYREINSAIAKAEGKNLAVS